MGCLRVNNQQRSNVNKICIVSVLLSIVLSGCVTGTVSVSGNKFKRDNKSFRIVGKGIDWAVQPEGLSAFKSLVRQDSKLGINLYFAYASPGLGKPLFVANGSGKPYSDEATLKRNSKYWDEVKERIDYANGEGITVVVANTFVDQRVFSRYGAGKVTDDWMETVNFLKDGMLSKSVMFVPMSEYDEGSSADRTASVNMSNETKKKVDDPVSLHPLKSSAKDIGVIDFVIHQGYDVNRIKADLGHGKPVIVAEDQQAANNDDLKIKRFNEAEVLGAVYIFTGNNFGFSDKMKAFLKSL